MFLIVKTKILLKEETSSLKEIKAANTLTMNASNRNPFTVGKKVMAIDVLLKPMWKTYSQPYVFFNQ